MKRTIAAVSLAVLSVSAFAAEAYEQTQFDRGLYTVEQNASAGSNAAENRVWENDHNFIAPAQ